MPLKFTLDKTIERENITKYRLSKESGVRANTIASLCNGDARSLSVETLDAIIDALNRLSESTHGLDSVVEYVKQETP